MTRGFHAFLGNPPWVSYAGRAAQPLDDGLRSLFDDKYESFAGFKNLQGMFIERAASLLRAAGRLGLVVPSSMSEQEGYAPTRRAHDRLCACDAELRDLGTDAFVGVFQPCMALVSTRRPANLEPDGAPPWPVERQDLDAEARALLNKMAALPPLPEELFGERGLQTSGADVDEMREAPDATHTVALRVGGDIEPFRRKPPSLFADPELLGKRLRPPSDWAAVRLLIRQTARVPMAVLSDGGAFRNSLLAGFESPEYPASFLVAYLNSTPIRWLHYMRHRDARQGMPQMKIGHLRVTPAPPRSAVVSNLAARGQRLSDRNDGLDKVEQARIDQVVADAFDLSGSARALVGDWAARL